MTKKDYQLVARCLRHELDMAIGNYEAFGSRAIVAVIKSLADSFQSDNERFSIEVFFNACGIGQELPELPSFSVRI